MGQTNPARLVAALLALAVLLGASPVVATPPGATGVEDGLKVALDSMRQLATDTRYNHEQKKTTRPKKGLPIEVLEFEDLPGKLTGGSGVIKLVKGGPNPNAAVVLLNWLSDQEGQLVFEEHVRQKSRRVDVDAGLEDYILPKPGVKYHDDYAYEFYTKERPRARKRLVELLGR